MYFSKKEFSEGGVALFACFIGVGVGFSSLSYYTAGMFMTSFESEFGWSRSVISSQALIGVFALIFLSPLIGALTDKVGTRIIASVSHFLYGLSFLALSTFLNSISSFIFLSLIAAIGAAGSTPVTFTRTITGWFDQSRGLALGLTLVGTGVAAFLAPLLLAPIIEEQGWRVGAKTLAWVVLAGALLVALLLRDNTGTQASSNSTTDNTVGHAIKEGQGHVLFCGVFWLLATVFFLVAFAVSGLIVHFIPMLKDGGMSLQEAGKYASVIGISVIMGRLVIGLLIDQYFAPRVALCVFTSAAAALAFFVFNDLQIAVLAAFAIGLTMGAEVDLISFLTSRYFHLSIYGRVYGILYAVFIIGSAVSPVLMGALYDSSGSYTIALSISIVALIIASALTLLLPKYPGADL